MKYLALLVLAVAGASYALEKSLRGPRFERGKLYKYDVEFNMTAGILGLDPQKSAAVLRADAYIYAKSDKELILKIQNVVTSGSVKAIESMEDIPLRPNRDLEQRLSTPIKFTMENGMIKSYTLSQNENLESKKIKKSILRSLHMYIPERALQELESNRKQGNLLYPVTYNKTENTENGTHIARYMITSSPYVEFPYEKNVINISRFDNHEGEWYPSYKQHHNFEKQGCAEVCKEEWNANLYGAGCPPGLAPHHGPMKVAFQHNMDLSPVGNTLSPDTILTVDVHYAKMYDQEMAVLFRHRLIRTRVSSDSITEPSGQQTYTDLFEWDKEINEKEIEDMCEYKKGGDYVSTARNLLAEIARLIVRVELENYESTLLGEKVILLRDVLKMFTFDDFQSLSRSFVKPKSQLLQATDEDKVVRQVWLNILPVVGTTESIKFIAQYVKDSNNLLKWEIKDILESIPQNIERPSEEIIKELREITRRVGRESHHLHSAAYITLGRVIGRTCHNTPVVRSQSKQRSSLWQAVSPFESSSSWSRSAECPKALVHEIVEEITRKLKTTHKPEEMVVYIDTLSHIGTYEVLESLKEYIYTTAENLQELSPRFTDFMQTMTVYSLHNLVGKYPEQILDIVHPIYFNETETPKVRNAAFSVMIKCQPSMDVLDQVVTKLWYEQSLEVGSYVYSTMETLGNSSLPCMQLTAQRIKQVFPHMKRFDVGVQHAKNNYFTYFDDHRNFGLENRCEYVPSNESYIPSVLYKSLSYSMESLKEVIAQFSLNGEGLTQEHIIEKITEYMKVPAIPTIEDEAAVFGDAIPKSRIPEGPRFTLFSRLFYQSSYLYLDSRSYRRVMEDMAEVFTQYLKNGDRTVRGYLIKLMIPSSYQTVAIPKTLPYPVEFRMSQPMILAVRVKNLERNMPSTERFNLQVKPSLYWSKIYTHQVKNLGDCKEVGVYHEQKIAASFPFQIRYEVEQFPNVTIKYKIPASQRRVFAYHTEAGTYAAKKELQRWPASIDRQPIRTIPTPFKFEETVKMVGLPPLHVQLNTEDMNIFREELPSNSAEAIDIITRKMLNAGWRYTSLNVTVLEDRSHWSADTEVTFRFRYHQEHVATSVSSESNHHQEDEDSWHGQWSSNYQPQSSQPSRQQSWSSSWGSEDADWTKYFEEIPKHGRVMPKDPSMLAEKGKNVAKILASRLPHMKYVLSIDLETTPEQSKAWFRMVYNHTYNETLHSVHVETAAKCSRKMHMMSFDHVIGFWEKPDEFEYDSRYGKQRAAFLSALSWARTGEVRPWEGVKIAANGELFYESNRLVLEDELENRVEDMYFLPETHKECVKHVRGGYPLSEECVKAIREYSIYNKLNMNIHWRETLPLSARQLLRTAEQYLMFSLYENLNSTLEEQNIQNIVQLQMDYIDKFVDEPVVDITIRKPTETLRFERVPTEGVQPLSSVYNQMETYFLEATNNTYLPTCTKMENFVRTFDLETYPFSPKDCHYVLTSHCARKKNFAVVLHGKQEIKIHVGRHTLVLTPRKSNREQFTMKFNGEQHKVYDVLLLDRENEIYAYVENYTRNHQHIIVMAERAGLKVIYDGKNIKVMVHPDYKGELCGLCSEFDGEYLREFRGMDRCLYQDYLDFANSNLVKRNNQCQPDRLRGKRICDSGEKEIWQRGSTNHEDYEPTTRRNVIVTRGNEICFSVLPVPVCENDDPPTETETLDFGFHCLPKRDVTAQKMEQEAKWRILEELERKSVDYEKTVEVAKMC